MVYIYFHTHIGDGNRDILNTSNMVQPSIDAQRSSRKPDRCTKVDADSFNENRFMSGVLEVNC
jgi:hypothetical protein